MCFILIEMQQKYFIAPFSVISILALKASFFSLLDVFGVPWSQVIMCHFALYQHNTGLNHNTDLHKRKAPSQMDEALYAVKWIECDWDGNLCILKIMRDIKLDSVKLSEQMLCLCKVKHKDCTVYYHHTVPRYGNRFLTRV